MEPTFVDGDLLDQDVDAIVNAWNRNFIPPWLLLQQGVSKAIRRRAGYGPFREVYKQGMLPLGGAALTSAGRLPFKAIIHVAGIGLLWVASERSVRASVRNAVDLAQKHGLRSIAFPLVGAGTGGKARDRVERWMADELGKIHWDGDVRIVRFKKQSTPASVGPGLRAGG